MEYHKEKGRAERNYQSNINTEQAEYVTKDTPSDKKPNLVIKPPLHSKSTRYRISRTRCGE